MKRWMNLILVPGLLAVWGCSTSPPEKPESDRIKQDADRGFGELKREEDRSHEGD
jgi:hypothetical protein